MSDYGDTLRKERRLELAQRALPSDMLNEYGEITFATKTEGGQSFPAAAYAYVPDPQSPSTWKLRLWATPGGGPDAGIVGAAIAALGKGFRGNKVQIPADALPGVKAKVRAAWKKANPDKTAKDMPAVIASGEVALEEEIEELVSEEITLESILACGNKLELSVTVDDKSVSPSPEIFSAVNSLIQAAKVSYDGYEVKCEIEVEVGGSEDTNKKEFVIDLEGISQTPSDILSTTYEALASAVKGVHGAKYDLEVYVKVKYPEIKTTEYDDYGHDEPVAAPAPSYGYDTEDVEEFGSLPPALKAQLVKKLTAKAAAEKDPKKKAELEAKIKLYS